MSQRLVVAKRQRYCALSSPPILPSPAPRASHPISGRSEKMQSVLKKPAVQLINDSEGYRLRPNADQHILVAPAYQWLTQLP